MIKINQTTYPQSAFRIQRLSDFKDLGLGMDQYERPWLRRTIREKLKKKIGVFSKASELIATHWRNENKGYPIGFKDYYTYDV